MRTRVLLIVGLLVPCLATPGQAGILFGRKKDKTDPRMRIPELVKTLRVDRDADKRARAAEELRNYDGNAYPDIIPALVSALQTDKKPSVRAEAAQSLGKMRPISQNAGEALEQAMARDSSMRVRLQARSALLNYQWAGYRSGKRTDVPPLTPTGNEPPVISTTNPPPVNTTTPPPRSVPAGGLFRRTTPTPTTTPVISQPLPSTKEPPLAPPLPAPTPAPAPTSTPPVSPAPRTAAPLPPGDAGPELP
jgi:hypothetical protein